MHVCWHACLMDVMFVDGLGMLMLTPPPLFGRGALARPSAAEVPEESPRAQRRGVRELEGVGELPEVVAGEARVDDEPPRFPEEKTS